jgi:hypothetical protein
MSSEQQPKYRPVNAMIGTQPKFGPIPSEQLIPWFIIGFLIFMISNRILNLDWTWTALLIFWGCGSWWIVTGSKPWRFLSKFVGAPNWSRGRVYYHSLHSPPPGSRVKPKSCQAKKSKGSQGSKSRRRR